MTAVTATVTRNPRRWVILIVLILALFGISVDNTILVIALPTLATDLHASASDLQWMIDAYILVFAGLLLLSGALSDRYGRRRMLLIGLVLFGVGSALTPLVTTSEQLIALRAFMGLGAAFVMPATLSNIAAVFDADERPKAIAAWGSISAIGIVAGPLLGGYLLDHFAWPAVFLINVPFAILGIALTLYFVPESRSERRVSLDWIGAALSVVALVTLVYAIIEVPSHGWTDPQILLSFAVAAVTMVLFVWWERRIPEPMLDVALFRNPRFSAASLSVTLVFFALNGALFFVTLYLQQVLGLSALETGLRFIPIAVGVALASGLSAGMTKRFGAKITTTAGLLIIATGLASMAVLRTDSSNLTVSGILFLAAFGIGLAMTPATDAIMGALPPEQFGVGSAVNDTTREVGGALGVAVLGSIFAATYSAGMDVVGPLPLGPFAAQAQKAIHDSLAGAALVAQQIGGDVGAALLVTARDSFIHALTTTSVIGAVVAVGGALIALIWLPARAEAKPSESVLAASDGRPQTTIDEHAAPEPAP
jgi:EmrB/QacA subfamily drug resistance transporter